MFFCERIVYIDKHTPFNGTFAISLSGHIEQARLEQALARLQASHPALRCAIVERKGLPWVVAEESPARIALRIVERHTGNEWIEEIASEWARLFDPAQAPLMRVVWIRSDEASELILVGHHGIFDGSSAVMLLQQILALYDCPELDLGTHAPIRNIEELVPAEFLQNRQALRRIRRKAALYKLLLILKRAGRPLPHRPPWVLRWNVDRQTSEALTQRCRQENTTVFCALGVALSMAFREVRGAQASGSFYAPMDVRKFLPRIRQDELFAFSPGAVLLPEPVTPALSFWASARALRANITAETAKLKQSVHAGLLLLERLHPFFHRYIAGRKATPDKYDLTFSNMGRLELQEVYRDFRLEAIYSPLVLMPWRTSTLMTATSFRQQLDFALLSDETVLPHADAVAIKEKFMAILQAQVA